MSEPAGLPAPDGVSIASTVQRLNAEVRAIRFQVEPGPFDPPHAKSLSQLTDELSRLLSSELFLRALSSSDQFVQRSFVGFSEEFLGSVRDWHGTNRKYDSVLPYHAIYELLLRLYRVVEVLVSLRDANPTLSPDPASVEEQVRRDIEIFEASRHLLEISRLRWQVKGLQSRHDEIVIEHSAASTHLEEETAKAIEIAQSLEVSDLRYRAMTERKAEDMLVGKFKSFRNGHRWGYGLFLSGALSLMAIGVSLAFTLSSEALQNAGASPFSYPDLIWRITLVTGILGIATYLARQAGQHRTLATWASSICVQLQTFDAYTEQIGDPEQVILLRAEFAKRVFGTQPQLKGEPDQAAGAMDLIPIIAAIAKATKTEGVKAP